ncbi:MAG: ArsR/SmtB family transcription factor [Cellulosilyticaceae bacterium]
MEKLILLFKALSDETRVKILIILSKRDVCAKGLSKHLGISPAAISQHIKVLKESGIIIGIKEGYFVRYHLNADCFDAIKKFIGLMECPEAFENSPLNELVNLNCLQQCTHSQKKCCGRQTEGSLSK